MTTLVAARPALSPALALLAWFLLALGLALSGVVARVGPPIGPLGILGGVALGLLAHRRSPAVQRFIAAFPLRGLLFYQALRAPIGAAFLVLAADGRLPHEFADLAGWGDIATGLGALAAAACVPTRTALRRRVVLLWNLAGLFDILLVVATAQYLILGLGRRDMLAAFTDMPAMAMLPLFIVPTVILGHLAVFHRLRRT
jgi:cytochrome bd-type quinol oxidase subunit 2